jgi:ribosomal protein S6
LKELVSSLGGIHISDEIPKMIQLAYKMVKVVSNVRNKFNTAYFGWIKFTMDSDKVLELKKKLDLDPNFIRFLILKTVKENTIAAKRFVRGEIHRKPKTLKNENKEIVVPINKEEIDKEIDAMVAV